MKNFSPDLIDAGTEMTQQISHEDLVQRKYDTPTVRPAEFNAASDEGSITQARIINKHREKMNIKAHEQLSREESFTQHYRGETFFTNDLDENKNEKFKIFKRGKSSEKKTSFDRYQDSVDESPLAKASQSQSYEILFNDIENQKITIQQHSGEKDYDPSANRQTKSREQYERIEKVKMEMNNDINTLLRKVKNTSSKAPIQ